MKQTLTNHQHIEMVAHRALHPNPHSARTHSDKQVKQMAAGLSRWGVLPLIIDDTNMIVKGHLAWLAAGHLKLHEVPVIRKQFVSEADFRAFALFDNRIAELSGWDPKLLQENLNFLVENDYDVGITGFGLADLDFSVGGDSQNAEAETVELPAANAQPTSCLGDLWILGGQHRLHCADSRAPTSYDNVLADEQARIIFADPPYNVKIEGNVSGQSSAREFEMASGEMSRGEFTQFLRAVMRQCANHSVSGSIHYHCMDWRHCREMLDAADGIYSEFKQLICWEKNNGGLSAFYRSAHELVFVFKSGKAKHVNNFGLGETGRYRKNVVHYAGANTFRKGRDRDLADHVTVKPVALIADFLLDCSMKGDLVLDPFCGSGSTILAAHKTKRRSATIEIDPIYVDTAIRRFRDATGLTVIHADGRSFDEVAAERALAEEPADGE